MGPSNQQYSRIREEVGQLSHLPNGFYLYGDWTGVSVIAQGPFDWSKLELTNKAVHDIARRVGVPVDFSVQLDPPTAKQREGLFDTSPESPKARD